MSILIAAVIFIVVAVAAISFLFVSKKQKKPVSSKKSEPEKQPPKKPVDHVKSGKQDRQQPSKTASKPMETAERSLNLGSSLPICFSFEPSGEFLIVPCKNRQQVLFEVEGIDRNAGRKQSYRLTDDTVVDCAFFRNSAKQLEVALALDRAKSIVSFVVAPDTNKFEAGSINIKDAGKLTVDKIKVAPDQSFVASLGDETYVRVFHPNGNLLFAKDTSQMRNTEISVSSNSELVAASSYTSEIVVYGVDRDRREVPAKVSKAFSFSSHKNSIQTIDFDSKQMYIASGSKDHKYNLWLAPLRWREGDIARLQWSGSLDEPISIVRLCPTMQLIACLTESGKLFFCDKSGIKKTVDVAHNAGVTHMEWAPNGRWIVVASQSSPFIYAYENPLFTENVK